MNKHLTALRILAACAAVIVFLAAAPPPPSQPAAASSSLALVFKTVLDVTRKAPANDEWLKAMRGEPLASGDQVKTGDRSLAVVKFLDNSILRVRAQSLLTVSGEGAHGSAIRTIELNGGAFGFEVKKQKTDEQFRLTSPTSVASIRGTRGKWSRGANDTLVVTEGLVNLKNNVSNKDTDVPAGWVGISGPDGSLSSRQATKGELDDADAAATGGENDLRLELKDAKGNKKELHLKYNK